MVALISRIAVVCCGVASGLVREHSENVLALASESKWLPGLSWRKHELKEDDLFCQLPPNESLFSGPDKMYIAGNDAPACVTEIFEKLPLQLRTPSIYATVVGGLAGLNGLLTVTPKEAIVFYDTNPYMVGFAEMIVELIQSSSSRIEFMDAYFGRNMSEHLSKNNNSHALPPWNPMTLALDRKFKCAYHHLQVVYTSQMNPQGRISPKDRALRCNHITLFHNPRDFPNLQPRCSTPTSCPNNECSFFYGNGWLESEVSYTKVRTALHSVSTYFVNATAEVVLREFNEQVSSLRRGLNFVRGKTGKGAVIYTSNIQKFDKEWLEHVKTLVNNRTDVTIVQNVRMHVRQQDNWSLLSSCGTRIGLRDKALHAALQGVPFREILDVDGIRGRGTNEVLQTFLNGQCGEPKFREDKVYVDGNFGESTKKALQTFLFKTHSVGAKWREEKTRVDGHFGQASVQALQTFLNAHCEESKVCLQTLGVDGNFGTRTVKALQTFLNTHCAGIADLSQSIGLA